MESEGLSLRDVIVLQPQIERGEQDAAMRGRERVKTNISDFPKEEKFEVLSKEEKEERKTGNNSTTTNTSNAVGLGRLPVPQTSE